MVIIVVMVWNKNPEIVDVTGVGDGLARNIFIYGF
jgi:spore coat protein U-like protein